MPTIFFDYPTIFGDRSPQKPKKAIFDNESAGRQYAHAILLFLRSIVSFFFETPGSILLFLGPDLVPDNILCMDIEDKGLRYSWMELKKLRLLLKLHLDMFRNTGYFS